MYCKSILTLPVSFLSHCVAHCKSVSWRLGCDGDVQVIIIGEMDEFKSSKILHSERKAASLHNSSQYGHVSISFCLSAAHLILMFWTSSQI